MKEDVVLAALAETVMAFYKAQLKSTDPFEAYTFKLRLKVAMSPSILQARFIRGYHLLADALSKENPL